MDPTTNHAAVEPAAPEAPTPASAWKTGGLYQLPSGNVARLRRPSLIARATMPGKLERVVLRYIAAEEQPAYTEEDRLKNYVAHSEAFVAVAAAALVSPRLIIDRAPNPDADEIGPDQLADRDYTWIYHVFVEGSDAESSDRFRAAE